MELPSPSDVTNLGKNWHLPKSKPPQSPNYTGRRSHTVAVVRKHALSKYGKDAGGDTSKSSYGNSNRSGFT